MWFAHDVTAAMLVDGAISFESLALLFIKNVPLFYNHAWVSVTCVKTNNLCTFIDRGEKLGLSVIVVVV